MKQSQHPLDLTFEARCRAGLGHQSGWAVWGGLSVCGVGDVANVSEWVGLFRSGPKSCTVLSVGQTVVTSLELALQVGSEARGLVLPIAPSLVQKDDISLTWFGQD